MRRKQRIMGRKSFCRGSTAKKDKFKLVRVSIVLKRILLFEIPSGRLVNDCLLPLSDFLCRITPALCSLFNIGDTS